MGNEPKASAGFRRRLKVHLESWRQSGLLDAQQADGLARQYRLDDLAGEGTRAIMMAIYIIAALLMGAAVITFVAAHWAGIIKPVKIVMILGLMLACHVSGFVLWRGSTRPWLGHCLIIIGVLIFGANISLLAQMFHIHEDWHNGIGAWAIGAAAVAWALSSTPAAVIAIALSFLYFCGAAGWQEWPGMVYPAVAAAVFLPLATRKGAGLIQAMALLAVGLALIVVAVQNALGCAMVWWVLATLAVGSLFAAWGFARSAGGRALSFVPILLGYIALLVGAYMASFHEFVPGVERRYDNEVWEHLAWQTPTFFAASLSLGLWAVCLRRSRCKPVGPLMIGAMLAAIVLPCFIVWGTDVVIAVAGNVAFGGLIVCLIWHSIMTTSRLTFWAGVLLAGLMIVSRFLEYEQRLMLKAGVFLACGLAMIAAGILFERHFRRQKAVQP